MIFPFTRQPASCPIAVFHRLFAEPETDKVVILESTEGLDEGDELIEL